MNFEYVTYYIITAFGQTATTFTSQNHAAGEFGRCRRILRLCLGLSLLCSTVPFFCDCPVPRYALGAFYAECCGHSERRRADFVHAAL